MYLLLQLYGQKLPTRFIMIRLFGGISGNVLKSLNTLAGDFNQLHLQNGIMLGFGGRAMYHKKVPPGVWTLSLETGFVGCVRDLVLDGVAINLVSLSLEQDYGIV